MARYFKTVADHYGLEMKHVEWNAAEEPGESLGKSFYVTHIREPVDRAVSHFKCAVVEFHMSCYDSIQMSHK